jgi:hypothetical protein
MYAVTQLVENLRHKSEGRGFDSWNVTEIFQAQAALRPGKGLITHCREGWVGLVALWKDMENRKTFIPTGARALARPAHSGPLYLLLYSHSFCT